MNLKRPTRRQIVVAGILGAVGGAAGEVGKQSFVLLDKLTDEILPTAGLSEFMPYWDEIQVVPGSHHPINGYHPDIEAALNSIVPLLKRSENIHRLPLGALPAANMAKDLLLIGGPISSVASRQIHGYQFSGKKISERAVKRTGLRWSFYYPKSGPNDPTYSRYINGQLTNTKPKAIVDAMASGSFAGPLYSAYSHESGFISSDYLLLTVVPNVLRANLSGRTIVDIADLQGQGDKIFAKLLSSRSARNELNAALKGKKHYQALYEVPVSHDHGVRITKPGIPKLVGVQPVSV